MREFRADTPKQLGLRAITEHKTAERKLDLPAIKGVYAIRIVGIYISSWTKAQSARTRSPRPTHGTVTGPGYSSPTTDPSFEPGSWCVLSVGITRSERWTESVLPDNASMDRFLAPLQKNVLSRRS